jgi:hypothetical protein
MRLITFEDSVRGSRIGALAPDGRIVDLNSACALYLRDVENEGAFNRLADALVPPNMRDVVSTGAVSGGNAATEYLKVGDVMECEIEGIGILRNRVVLWQESLRSQIGCPLRSGDLSVVARPPAG